MCARPLHGQFEMLKDGANWAGADSGALEGSHQILREELHDSVCFGVDEALNVNKISIENIQYFLVEDPSNHSPTGIWFSGIIFP